MNHKELIASELAKVIEGLNQETILNLLEQTKIFRPRRYRLSCLFFFWLNRTRSSLPIAVDIRKTFPHFESRWSLRKLLLR